MGHWSRRLEQIWYADSKVSPSSGLSRTRIAYWAAVYFGTRLSSSQENKEHMISTARYLPCTITRTDTSGYIGFSLAPCKAAPFPTGQSVTNPERVAKFTIEISTKSPRRPFLFVVLLNNHQRAASAFPVVSFLQFVGHSFNLF